MRTDEAAEKTIAALKGQYTSQRDQECKTKDHALWMLDGISMGYVQHEKAHRWLGYAQGLLVAHGEINLEEAKLINKEASS